MFFLSVVAAVAAAHAPAVAALEAIIT